MGVLDVDLTGPSIPRLLGLEDAKITQAPGGWLPVEVHASQLLPPIPDVPETRINGTTEDGSGIHTPTTTSSNTTATASARPIGPLYAISLGFLLPSRSSAVVWRGPKKTAMVRQFLTDVLWPPLDYLLIDTPPGTSDEHISLAETLLQQTVVSSPNTLPKLAGAVIVTTPQAVAVSDVRKELSFCRKVGIGVLGVVENMSGFVCECCGEQTNLFGKGGGEVMAQEFGVKFLGRVPVDGQWGLLVEEGTRPGYGTNAKRETEDEEHEEDVNDSEEEVETATRNQAIDPAGREKSKGGEQEREDSLLVDKYRSCLLASVFEAVTTQLVDIIRSPNTTGT